MLTPLAHYDFSGNMKDRAAGERRIAQGKMACLILAGGQGSRLGFEGPKGTMPVTLFKKKSLFQLFLEKTLAASRKAGSSLPLAIMTSPLNHEATRDFLEKHGWFGLSADQVDLFSQGVLPLLDEKGCKIEEAPGKWAVGPDGNGGALKALYQAGIWNKWRTQGVESISVILIDNPLADPFDAELCGYQARQEADVVLKAILRKDPEEKVGVVAEKNGKICVIEYSELSEGEKNERFKLANTSLFCFSMPFVQKAAHLELPLHRQKKKTKIAGHIQEVWKSETFIFDLLPFADRACVLCYPREEIFAPLKNASGEASLAAVQAALLHHERQVFFRLTGTRPPPEREFELDPAFYYPTPALIERWRGKPFPQENYIH